MSFYCSPRIVTNGLIFLIDYDNPKSWVSGSLYWRDLVANQNSINIYTSHSQFDSNGRPNFTGGTATNRIFFSGSTEPGSLQNNYTVQVWWRRDGLSGVGTGGSFDSYHSVIYGIGDAQIIVNKDGTRAGWWGKMPDNQYAWTTTDANNFPIGSWRLMTFVKSSEVSESIWYLNNTLNSITPDYTASNSTGTYIVIGRDDAYTPYGTIGMVMIYNRKLSFDEIKQNYYATKPRFG